MISEIATIAGRSVQRKVSGLVTKIVLWMVAGLAGVVAVGFLTGSGYMWLKDLWGGPAAALAVATFWLLVAVVLAVSATHAGSAEKKGPTVGEQIRAALPAVPGIIALMRSRSSGPPKPPLTERARLAAEREVRRLGPVQRIGAGLLAGFVLGRIVDRKLSK